MEYVKPENGMVEMEIDAARVLADLSVKGPDPRHKGVRDGGGEDKAAEEAGKKGKRAEEGKVGASTSQTPLGRRGKQNLSEAEREAKRLRRILANRESARQTILRRQALREELAQKVAALSSENQHMKMEKEMVMQEFQSLKEKNRLLKEQLAKLSMSQTDPGKKPIETEPSLTPSAKFSGSMHPAMANYMWSPWTPCNYIKCDPSTSFSGPSFCFSSNSSLNPPFHETPTSSTTELYEEKQLLPTVDETEVSCSLTLGLEIDTKPKAPAIEIGHENASPVVPCLKEPNPGKGPHCGKAAAEARRRRLEIIKLNQTHRRA